MRDEFDMFDRVDTQAEFERRQKMIAFAEQMKKIEEEQEAKLRASAAARSLEVNRKQLKAQYERAGVKPLFVDDAGWPRVSLTMMFKLGYQIIDMDGERVFVQPPPEEKPRRRKNYAQEGS